MGTEVELLLETTLGEGRRADHEEEEPSWVGRRDFFAEVEVDVEDEDESDRAREGAAGLVWDIAGGGAGREDEDEVAAGVDREEGTGAGTVDLVVFGDPTTIFATEVGC